MLNGGNVTFLSLNKKVTKEVSQRGASKKCAPFGNPSRNAIRLPKMYRFSEVCSEKTFDFCIVGVQKSEHFWTPVGDAAQGFLKGTCLFGMSP